LESLIDLLEAAEELLVVVASDLISPDEIFVQVV